MFTRLPKVQKAHLYTDSLCHLNGTTHQFALGWWLFIDGIAYASTLDEHVPIRFEDWVPGILSTVALTM